ncbi:phosphatase PAP2 family protein [Thermomonospora cellulosilytica]|uniref:Phosphatidic acid phosphatase type 2/haloperoxidase domain-containing protein n=1 Tax=Thermomonospora cellulosilytica TaxID=1411118 RepID=A0A7W3N372_9ACTN|nr:phosphatase PAP2 family protein [Thermomonospora cellulosilytica]MBA9006592.1 hypothetical protein [Thermomonospora cellulosilytica]
MTAFMHVMSFVGSAGFYLPLLVLAFWCVNPRAAARAAVALALSAMINVLLKMSFAEPRPYWTDPALQEQSTESSFGMPSGHAQGSLVAYGFLAYHLGRRWAWAAAAVIVALVGASRVYLGVHSFGQVLAGWTVGTLVLVAVIRLRPVVARWWLRRRMAGQLVLSGTVALGLLGCAVLLTELVLEDLRLPESWRRAIVAAGGTTGDLGLERAAMSAGLLCGVLAGLSWLTRAGWFDPSVRSPGRSAGRVLAGLAGLAPIAALWAVLPDHPAADFAVLTLIGLWLSAGAPEAFVRLGLAERTTPELTRPGEPALTGGP